MGVGGCYLHLQSKCVQSTYVCVLGAWGVGGCVPVCMLR